MSVSSRSGEAEEQRNAIEDTSSAEQLAHTVIPVDDVSRHLTVPNALLNTIGTEFFNAISVNLAREVNADCLYIGEVLSLLSPAIRTVSVCLKGTLGSPFEYLLEKTPAENALRNGRFSMAEGLTRTFPDVWIARHVGAEACMDLRITDSKGAAAGIIEVLWRRWDEHLKDA